MTRPVIQPTTRQEAAAKFLHDKGCGFNDWVWFHGGRFQDMDLAEWALEAGDAWDADHGTHRITLDDETVERAVQAIYGHQENGLTCYDHHPTPDDPIWCCPCGEHSIRTGWRQHMARAVLSAAVKQPIEKIELAPTAQKESTP